MITVDLEHHWTLKVQTEIPVLIWCQCFLTENEGKSFCRNIQLRSKICLQLQLLVSESNMNLQQFPLIGTWKLKLISGSFSLTNKKSFSTNPLASGRCCAAVIRGLQQPQIRGAEIIDLWNQNWKTPESFLQLSKSKFFSLSETKTSGSTCASELNPQTGPHVSTTDWSRSCQTLLFWCFQHKHTHFDVTSISLASRWSWRLQRMCRSSDLWPPTSAAPGFLNMWNIHWQ